MCLTEELMMTVVMMLWSRFSLMGQDEAAIMNVATQKLTAALSKLRSSEDKVIKAMPAYSEEAADDAEEVPSRSNLVNYHNSTMFE